MAQRAADPTSVPPPESPVETVRTSASGCPPPATKPYDPEHVQWLKWRLSVKLSGLSPPPPGRRHGGWQEHRSRVWDTLIEAQVAPTRLRRFYDCGQAAFVQQHNDDSGRYRVVLETCRDRWCAPCAAERRQLIVGHLAEHMRTGTHRLITLSLKSCGKGLASQLDRLTLCFRRLRQRVLWRERVDGGLAGFEVTWNAETRQWHPHLHAIVHGRWIGQADLSAAWRDVTGDSYIVDIRLIRHVDRVASYVAKYATKPLPAGLQRNRECLLEAVHAYTHRRTFIQFGDWAKHAFTRRPNGGEWHTLGFLAEVIHSDEDRPGFAAAINLAYESITLGLAMTEFQWLPPPTQDAHQ